MPSMLPVRTTSSNPLIVAQGLSRVCDSKPVNMQPLTREPTKMPHRHPVSVRMYIRRLKFSPVRLLAAFLATLVATLHVSPAYADADWPQKPVRIVVAAPAGSSVDIVARVIADGLKAKWSQPVIVDNKPAAGGTAGAAEVARAAADGHTLFLGYNGPLANAPALYSKLAYDPLRDFAPVIQTGSQPNLLVVSAALPVNTLGQLIAYAQQLPGKLNYASVGNGSTSHLCMELLKRQAGISLLHVPFNGGPPAVQAVLAGEVQALFTAPVNVLAQVKAGKLKALAVTGTQRFAPIPDIPTIAESGVPGLANFESTAWSGLVAPAATPREVLYRLNRAVNDVLAAPAVQKKLLDAGIEPGGGSADAFGLLMSSEARKWGEIIRLTGARVD
jgi:tripartite-type tricarboxylate transporter receptor subunit TctC